MRKKVKIYDYFVLIYSPKHSRAFASGYVPEQILIAEKALQRFLTPDEDVRHINGDTQDNRPENLEIISANNGYRVQSIGSFQFDVPRKTSPDKTFISCKFQRQCWKEIRAPIARREKIYLPYICSYQSEGDIYKCGIFWTYLDKTMKEKEGKSKIDK
jgi:HNH endonuclease